MANLHPNYKAITVVMTNGDTFETRSTYHNKVLNLDTDIHTHPAWKKNSENYVNLQANEIAKFNKKFGGIDFMINSADSAA